MGFAGVWGGVCGGVLQLQNYNDNLTCVTVSSALNVSPEINVYIE